MPRNEDAYRIGKYFLGKRPNSRMWCACWHDPRSRQTERRSLGTDDFQAAQIELARFVTRHGDIKGAEPSRMTVAQLLERHEARHVKAEAKADFARHARRLLEDYGDAYVAELTPARQAEFVAAMKAAGRSASYIDRINDSLRSALATAVRLGELAAAPSIASIPRDPWERRLPAREEIAAFWDAAAEDPHLLLFFVTLLNTGARPNAILALTRFQVDLERRLLNLHPPGRRATKKRNPVVPITDALLPWLKAVSTDRVVSWQPKRSAESRRKPARPEPRSVDRINAAWRRARERAGLPDDFTPYSVRHALATERRARGVPEWECAGWLGHSTSYATTEIYARYRPDYLSQARAAVDAWVKEIGGLLQQAPGRVQNPVRVSYVLGAKVEVLETPEGWSEWRDSNTRPQRPERCALPG